jgi:hypothetical protein
MTDRAAESAKPEDETPKRHELLLTYARSATAVGSESLSVTV